MIATDPAIQFNDDLTRLKLESLQKLAQALAEATNPADICRITKVLLAAKLIAPAKASKPEDRGRADRQEPVRATQHQERANDAPATAPRPDRISRLAGAGSEGGRHTQEPTCDESESLQPAPLARAGNREADPPLGIDL